MAIPITAPGLAPIAPIITPSVTPGTGGAAFHSAFADAVAKVDNFQQNAQASVDRFLSGESEELHQVALAAQRAELSFEMFMQVRNKVVAAYQEVMRMQV
jgi:flagellar hook-basal body complex protein FliE